MLVKAEPLRQSYDSVQSAKLTCVAEVVAGGEEYCSACMGGEETEEPADGAPDCAGW